MKSSNFLDSCGMGECKYLQTVKSKGWGGGSMESRYNRPELDVLRLVAFLFVLAFHIPDYVSLPSAASAWLPDLLRTGAFGVPVFFLLSAFLITELLFKERQARGRVRILPFYARRALRIWPLYFALLLGLTVLGAFIPGVGPKSGEQFAAFALFYANWHITLHGWVAGPVDPLWSISVEEQFYLLVPLAIAFGSRRLLSAFAMITIAASYVVIWLYARHPTVGDNGQWTNGLVQFQFLAAGCLLSNLLAGRLPTWRGPTRMALFGLGLALWFVAVQVCGVRSWDAHPTPVLALLGWLSVLAGAVLMFLALLGMKTPPALLQRGGKISYGLYMFHAVVLHLVFYVAKPALEAHGVRVPPLVALAIALALILGASIASYRWLETPFLRLKDRLASVHR